MNKQNLAIGVFDSGMGGLTVLRALRDLLPNESFIYLGDTARLPYGTKSPATVQKYSMQMARYLVDRQIKALVVACNSATTAALPHLQQMLPDLPVIGVVSPGAHAAVLATRNQRIAVLATEMTITADAYQKLIRAQLPNVSIYARACSVLVGLAEEGMVDNTVACEALKHYLSEVKDEDTILLGCTHFPVFTASLKKLLPPGVSIINPADATATVLKQVLEKNHLLNASTSQGKTSYLVTDLAKRFLSVGEIFLNEPLLASDIELIDAVKPS